MKKSYLVISTDHDGTRLTKQFANNAAEILLEEGRFTYKESNSVIINEQSKKVVALFAINYLEKCQSSIVDEGGITEKKFNEFWDKSLHRWVTSVTDRKVYEMYRQYGPLNGDELIKKFFELLDEHLAAYEGKKAAVQQ